jgi:DNA-directed RNA polymerase specialized sigma54-like protein
MSAVPFDTHAIVKTLQTKGFEVEQAEGITDALKDALAVAEIATKHDLQELQGVAQRDLKELQEVTQRDLKEFREATQRDVQEFQEATRRDLTELREATESQIRELRLEFKAEIASVRAEIAPLKWGMGLCAAGIVSLVIKAFF